MDESDCTPVLIANLGFETHYLSAPVRELRSTQHLVRVLQDMHEYSERYYRALHIIILVPE